MSGGSWSGNPSYKNQCRDVMIMMTEVRLRRSINGVLDKYWRWNKTRDIYIFWQNGWFMMAKSPKHQTLIQLEKINNFCVLLDWKLINIDEPVVFILSNTKIYPRNETEQKMREPCVLPIDVIVLCVRKHIISTMELDSEAFYRRCINIVPLRKTQIVVIAWRHPIKLQPTPNDSTISLHLCYFFVFCSSFYLRTENKTENCIVIYKSMGITFRLCWQTPTRYSRLHHLHPVAPFHSPNSNSFAFLWIILKWILKLRKTLSASNKIVLMANARGEFGVWEEYRSQRFRWRCERADHCQGNWL